MPDISPSDLHTLLQSDAPPRLIDVREPEEFAAGHIAGAVNIPLGILEHFTEGFAGSVDTHYLYCRSGGRGGMGKSLFESRSIKAVNLAGGLQAWIEAGLPIE